MTEKKVFTLLKRDYDNPVIGVYTNKKMVWQAVETLARKYDLEIKDTDVSSYIELCKKFQTAYATWVDFTDGTDLEIRETILNGDIK